ncbi:hypothetical protein [Palleronia pelagia]|uniref:Uncharacterized protein n=1 Tax=Palleronia pelagia TaxID=387096 RepID=A0A1H8IEI9_9RHOB|nr:hypothetical protein [Palleronia pelagia]SEN67260.1 hypothetical protein SAMN04488011_105214 [Palleronia pelagia]
MNTRLNTAVLGAVLGLSLAATAALAFTSTEIPVADRHHATLEMQERFPDLF